MASLGKSSFLSHSPPIHRTILQVDADDVHKQLEMFATAKERVHQESGKLLQAAPREYTEIYAHLDTLRYASEPDYTLIRSAMEKSFSRKGYTGQENLDWEEGGQYYAQTRMVPYDNRC